MLPTYTPVTSSYTWPRSNSFAKSNTYAFPFNPRFGYQQPQPQASFIPRLAIPPYLRPNADYDRMGRYIRKPTNQSVPMDLPTKMTEAAVSQRVPAAKQTQEHDCTLCQELVDNSQPGIFYSQLRYSPWMPNKTVKNAAMKSRAPCVVMCHTKERKDLLLRVYLMLLVKLVLCLIFCTVFQFGIIYSFCCLFFTFSPERVIKYRAVSYLMIVAITYSICLGAGSLAIDYFWEVVSLLICIIAIVLFLMALMCCLPLGDVISPIGFGLTESFLLIFFGIVTLILKYAYFMNIKTLILVYLVALIIPMYLLIDTWLIIGGMRFSLVPIESVVAMSITICTDAVLLPLIVTMFFFKRPCYIEIEERVEKPY
ncbi:uncharacterized protein LOC106070305 isoform X2 [Biomphalaria glabrata]|uniref:Uncharacterized protein LOC106070305 isoform X2 n=1 Tax=Biomphalaria glabrata TaxID=6526 RepID=A0A9W2YCG1_BIOGL|nr:uncharacterized protein LOC106070305 isoform X2 [Biomphalaria glabrata]